MSLIDISAFLGASLAFDDLLLPAGVGVVSLNQQPGYGDLRPWNAPGAGVATVGGSPQRLTIFRMGQDVASEANYWLAWTTVVNATRGYDTEDTTERTYYTGSGTPKWTNNVLALGGGPPYPQAYRELAVPAPTTALTAAVNTASSTGTDQPFMWVYTFVNDIGWESAPSPISNTLTNKPGTTFNLSGFDTAPAGAYGINRIRLYRYVPGASTSGSYFFLREWVIGSTPANPIDDARSVGSDPITTSGWRPPPSDGKGLVKLWNGMLGMGSGKSFRVCEPYTPYAWPLAYEIALSADFVAAAVWSQNAIILTTGDASIVSGSSPEGLDEEPAKVNRPCSSARGVVEFNEGEGARGAVWPSEEGLCWYGEGGFRLVTKDLLTREQWQAMVPSTMVASRYLGYYVAFYNDGSGIKGFIIDPRNPTGIYMLSTGYHAVFRDPLTDRLYVLDGTNIRRWNAGAALTATFRSKLIQRAAPENIGVIEVIAKGYPVAVKMWADGVLRFDRTLTGPGPHKIKPGWMAEQFQFEVSSAARVIAVRAGSTVDDLRQPA